MPCPVPAAAWLGIGWVLHRLAWRGLGFGIAAGWWVRIMTGLLGTGSSGEVVGERDWLAARTRGFFAFFSTLFWTRVLDSDGMRVAGDLRQGMQGAWGGSPQRLYGSVLGMLFLAGGIHDISPLG